MGARAILAALAAGLGLAAAAAGCAESQPGTPTPAPAGEAGVGGTLVWAVAGPVRTLDPLSAASRAERILTRQIHEPLVERLRGPFGEGGRVPGPARRLRPAAGGTVWVLRLRPGIRFQDGSLLNAAAVQANAERWLASAAGRELLPRLVAVDSPTPASVRFILSAPDPKLPERLASPRLGLVSPRALAAGPSPLARPRRDPFAATGSGPFELREASGGSFLLARNTAWWGTAEDLGPALERVVVRVERSGSVRTALLDSGDVQLADELDREQAAFVARNPLLTTLPGPRGRRLGIERSVRGIRSGAEIPSLSAVWLTNLRQ